MDKRVLRERMRRKKRQMMIRHYTKIGLCVIGMILAVVFVVRGIIIPIAHHVAGGGSSDQTVQAQADTEEVQANSDAAVRQPLKGKSDTDKIAAMTAGWHEDANGKWYQNTDGTYFSNGFQDIDGVTYSFDENGYIQTGWVEKGVKDYYFNEDGSYDPSKVRPMLALTFDDGRESIQMNCWIVWNRIMLMQHSLCLVRMSVHIRMRQNVCWNLVVRLEVIHGIIHS